MKVGYFLGKLESVHVDVVVDMESVDADVVVEMESFDVDIVVESVRCDKY